MVLAESVVTFPLSFQITTKVRISDSKQYSIVLHVNVIVECVTVGLVTTGGPGFTGGKKKTKVYM